jgi:hypothetical protein
MHPLTRICFVFLLFIATRQALAGGGPEYVLLVVNSRDAASKTVANYFIDARRVPVQNILYLDWKLGDSYISVDQFRNELLMPIQQFLQKRKLSGQIDCIVYSSGFPYGVHFNSDVPPQLVKHPLFAYPTGSLSGMTYLFGAVMTKDATKYGPVAWESNRYIRLREMKDGKVFELPQSPETQLREFSPHRPTKDQNIDPASIGSHGFRSWYGWGPKGELLEAGGSTYILSAMLGVTNGRGNSPREIVRYLRESPMADGTFPKGTIYFMENSDIRSNTRRPGFEMAVEQLGRLGVKAQIMPGTIPQRRADVQGLLSGTVDFNWQQSGSTILRGAICENLTSYSAMFDPNQGQTPCTEFLKLGATGTSGTVAEPYAQQGKFPHAMIQVHYARGCNLVESFYQSVYMPYQLLILGDPLCRPWANIPSVTVEGIDEKTPLKGVVKLRPSATLPRGGECDRFELIRDGQRLAACPAGGTLEIDTSKYTDGYHELRVVAFERGPIETQGAAVMGVQFNNFGRTIEFIAGPQRIAAGRKINASVKCADVDGVAIYHNGETVGTVTGSSGAVEIDSVKLGDGPVTLTASGWKAGKEVVSAQPVKLFIQNGIGSK